MLVAYAVFPLWLTSFPSQDGPVHLYYADVMKDLLRGNGQYGGHFTIKHLFPPYSLTYYLLIVLNAFAPPLLAERIFVSLYVVILALGFRYFLTNLNPQAAPLAVVVFPFVLNKFVYLGFYSFDLGLALAIVVSGCWIAPLTGVWRWMLFLLLTSLLMLAHPVALLIELLFMALYLAASVLITAARTQGNWPRRVWYAAGKYRSRVLSLAVASCLSLYVLRFVTRGGETTFPTVREIVGKMGKLILLGPVSPFQRWYYALPLGAFLLAVALVAVVYAVRGKQAWTIPQTAIMASGAACALAYAFAPDTFNGAWGFAQRFAILGVLYLLAGLASTAAFQERAGRTAIIGLAVVLSLGALAYQNHVCRQLQIAQAVYGMPRMGPSAVGEIAAGSVARPSGLAFIPSKHVGTYYFQHSKAVLLDAPWTGFSYIPIGARDARLGTAEQDGRMPDFVLLVGTLEGLPRDSRLVQLIEHQGFREKWSGGIASIFAPGAP